MYEFVNINPCKRRLGDCVIRALSLALNQQWERTYIDLCIEGYIQCDMPNANNVWEAYLIYKGFKRYPVPEAMTFEEFAKAHPDGQLYVVATGSHVAVIRDETLYDNWDGRYYFDGETSMDGGSSNRGSYEGGSSNRGSYGRGRNANRDRMGRYAERGYSRADAEEDFKTEIEELMNKAPDEQSRKKLERLMNEMK